MNDRSGGGTGSFEVKIRTNTAKFTNMIIARFRESRYLVRESEVFIKDKTKVASRVSSNAVSCTMPKLNEFYKKVFLTCFLHCVCIYLHCCKQVRLSFA